MVDIGTHASTETRSSSADISHLVETPADSVDTELALARQNGDYDALHSAMPEIARELRDAEKGGPIAVEGPYALAAQQLLRQEGVVVDIYDNTQARRRVSTGGVSDGGVYVVDVTPTLLQYLAK